MVDMHSEFINKNVYAKLIQTYDSIVSSCRATNTLSDMRLNSVTCPVVHLNNVYAAYDKRTIDERCFILESCEKCANRRDKIKSVSPCKRNNTANLTIKIVLFKNKQIDLTFSN